VATDNVISDPVSNYPGQPVNYFPFLLNLVHNATITGNTVTGFGGQAIIHDLGLASDGTLITSPNTPELPVE
jgi:hypothetical protein